MQLQRETDSSSQSAFNILGTLPKYALIGTCHFTGTETCPHFVVVLFMSTENQASAQRTVARYGKVTAPDPAHILEAPIMKKVQLMLDDELAQVLVPFGTTSK